MRRFLGTLLVPVVTVAAAAGVAVIGAPSAFAAPSQTGGADVATWQPGWSWTYDTTFTSDSSSIDVTVHETETYTVTNPPIVAKDGYTDAYQVAISGSINSCSGTADGYSISNCSGSVSGTAWYEVGDLALIEEDQTQHLSGTVEGFVGFNATFAVDLTASPALVLTDFRLHDGDSWHIDTTVAESGSYSYSSSVKSGSGPISGSQPIDTTANVVTGTTNQPIANAIAVDEVTANDSANGVSVAAYWAPSYANLAYLQLDMTRSDVELTQDLAGANTPVPSTGISEQLAPTLSCAGGPVQVSGTLQSGLSGQDVTVTTDEEPFRPGDLVTTTTTTGSGGAYSATITAPVVSDGLDKPGVRGAWAVLVTSGSARSAATVEVTPQDCTSVTYTGATSAPEGSTATVTATVTDLATGGPADGVPVTFALSGQSATATATTGANGVAAATLAVAGPPATETLTVETAVTADDAASTSEVPFTVAKDPSQVSISSSDPEATQGTAVSFTATVTPVGPEVAAPTGTVTFSVDGAQLGSPVTLVNGSATSQPDTTLPEGASTVTAVYSGDANFTSSSGTYTQQVHPPLTPTTTTLTASPSSSVFGQAVELTATVAASTGTPNGEVIFTVNGSMQVGSAMLDQTAGDDQASVTVDDLPTGNDTVTAAYQGDDFVTFAASTSAPVAVAVASDPTTVGISLVSPTVTPVTGEGLTYRVTVAPDAPGSGTPSGTVSLSVDGTEAGSAVLASGSAAIAIAGLPAGTHQITMHYGGNTDFGSSTATLTQDVAPAATTTVLETSPDPSQTGQVVTLTATVAPVAPGAGIPTGLVTFFDGTTAVGSAALAETASGDQAVIGLANLPEGTDSLTARYAGDDDFTASTSAAVSQTVHQAPPEVGTTTTVASSANPSVFGQPVTFTATVTAADGSVPTGSVQFSVDGAALGSPVPVGANGQAVSAPVADLAAGAHTVVAAYSGATTATEQYEVSGAVVTQQVDQAAVTATVAVSPASPITYGQQPTFTVQLHPVAPGAGTPGGTAQFVLDGTDVGAPVALTDGSASTTFTSATLDPGSYTVGVITSGDSDFVGATASTTFVVAHVPVVQDVTVDAGSPDYYGNAVIIDDTVSPAFGPGTPVTGVVQFYADGTLLGQDDLLSTSHGQRAGLGLATLPAGTLTITAVYEGNAFYAGGTSPPVSFTVERAPTELTATPAAVSGTTLRATLTNTGNDGSPVAGQPVEFAAGSTVLCAATVTDAQGVASCDDSAHVLAVLLAHGYTVIYRGDADYLGSARQEGLVGSGPLGGLL